MLATSQPTELEPLDVVCAGDEPVTLIFDDIPEAWAWDFIPAQHNGQVTVRIGDKMPVRLGSNK